MEGSRFQRLMMVNNLDETLKKKRMRVHFKDLEERRRVVVESRNIVQDFFRIDLSVPRVNPLMPAKCSIEGLDGKIALVKN